MRLPKFHFLNSEQIILCCERHEITCFRVSFESLSILVIEGHVYMRRYNHACCVKQLINRFFYEH